MIDVAMGGRAAEELVYGKEYVTSGAHSDIQRATEVARSMVCDFGMSEKVGTVAHDFDKLSTPTKQLIEGEIRTFIHDANSRAMDVLQTHRVELDRLAKALTEYETLSAEEIHKVIKGEKLEPLKPRPVRNGVTPTKQQTIAPAGIIASNA